MSGYPTPRPQPHGLNADWYRHLARGELHFQRCGACGTWRHPPRVLCPACGADRWSWEESGREGELFSWTVTHQALHPDFADVVPYSVLIVELDEGPRIVCSARDLPHERLELGLRLRIGIEPVDDEVALPFAHPAG